MARPRTPIGTFGDITFIPAGGGKVKARVRFRDHDGQLRLVQATGANRSGAERALKEKLTKRENHSAGSSELTPDSSFRQLVDVWLEDLDVEGKLAESTRALYERNMRQLVMPAFENYLLREISVRRVDQFIKRLASAKSYSTAKQARTVLSLAFGLAVRYDALRENPVRDTARLRKPSSETMALTLDEVAAIRDAVRSWRRAPGTPGPPPDGQLEQIIEVMLGTSARIGEVLAIRKLKKEELIAEYVARRGRMPSARTIVELRAQAALATRPPKEVRSLADLTAGWRQRAATRLGTEPTGWSQSVIGRDVDLLTAKDVPLAAIETIGAEVVVTVSVKRAVWTHWNLMAEAAKQTMDLRFATSEDREAVVGLVVDAAQARSVVLTPPELAVSPARFQREDGTSRFRPRHGEKYSSIAVLEAEGRLLARADKVTAPTVSVGVAGRAGDRGTVSLTDQQRRAVESICRSRRQVDLLVGPAGAGKTTTMRALRAAWISEHGRGSVVGLAPSAAAAQALADDLGVACENTSKWLHEYDRGRTAMRRGQLVIVDEATLADTVTLDRLTGIAAGGGAKILLVGDPHQLQSVDAGGAFALLVDRRADVPALNEIHRFANEWEKEASLALSRGDVQVISTYGRHKRIREGLTDEMVDAAYAAWRDDCAAGLASILVTESARDVRALNERARAERLLLDGAVDHREVDLVDGCRASVGDVVITRQNDRRIRTLRSGWVKNGDRWLITDIRRDGSVLVKRLDGRGGRTVLPPEYVAEHVDLGYAVTAHRAQGVTVDTAHVVVTASTTRENLYVSMTRGRESNIAYVALDQPDDSHSTPEADDVTARTVLYGVLQHSGADLSATQTIEAEYELHGGIDRLAAELETIAAEAQHDRFAHLLSRSGLTAEQHTAVVESTAFGPLTAALRRAEAYHHDLERLLPRVVGRHGLDDADDIAAVLRYRVEKLAATPPRGCRLRPRLIAGLIPEPLGPMSAEDRQAIDQRKELIESRARRLAEEAVTSGEAWTRRLADDHGGVWDATAATVSAYRDRYKVTSDLPVGGGAKNDAQRADRQRALAALRAVRSGSAPQRPARAEAVAIRAVSAP